MCSFSFFPPLGLVTGCHFWHCLAVINRWMHLRMGPATGCYFGHSLAVIDRRSPLRLLKIVPMRHLLCALQRSGIGHRCGFGDLSTIHKRGRLVLFLVRLAKADLHRFEGIQPDWCLGLDHSHHHSCDYRRCRLWMGWLFSAKKISLLVDFGVVMHFHEKCLNDFL